MPIDELPMERCAPEDAQPRKLVRSYPSYHQLGGRVNAVQITDVIETVEEWIACHSGAQYIAVTGMHGMTEAYRDPDFKRVLNQAGLVVPDGMPLVWLARYHGFKLKRRVYGPELMLKFCEATAQKGYRHFFYGGGEGIARLLETALKRRFPHLVVAGTYTPPFRPLTPQEETEIVDVLAQAQPDILWVGLSTPKQEKWMHAHRHLPVPAMIGVGAAFDLNAGRLKQAPECCKSTAWNGSSVYSLNRLHFA